MFQAMYPGSSPAYALSPRSIWLARRRRSQMGFDFFEEVNNVVDFIGNGVQGLYNAAAETISETAQIVGNVIKVVLETVGAIFGVVPWERVREDLGEIARGIGQVMVLTNPARFVYTWVKESKLTAHSFKELDKFTGGMITTAVNVGDLLPRAMRGDPISKVELVQDALFILQVAITIATAGLAAAPAALFAQAVIGGVTREVCSHQTDKETCKALVVAATVAAGAYANGAQQLSEIPRQVIDERIRSVATLALIQKCRDNKLLGDRECAVIGKIVVDYLSMPADTDWNEYLAKETARLGVALIIEQLYPPKSPERAAITNVITQLPPEQLEVQLQPEPKKGNAFLLLAAAAGGVLMIAGS